MSTPEPDADGFVTYTIRLHYTEQLAPGVWTGTSPDFPDKQFIMIADKTEQKK